MTAGPLESGGPFRASELTVDLKVDGYKVDGYSPQQVDAIRPTMHDDVV